MVSTLRLALATFLLPLAVAADAQQSTRPVGLADHYSGRMSCPRGDTYVHLSVFWDGRGKIRIYPPSHGTAYEVDVSEPVRGTIRLTPTGPLEDISYILRKYRVPQFGADMGFSPKGLYGTTTEPGCGPLALLAHSAAVNLTPEQFNRLAQELVDDIMRRR